MKIADRDVRDGPPYIIAEISGNHAGILDNALKLIQEAKDAGADAVKFQAYTSDTITLDCDNPDFVVKDGPWKGRRLYDLYESAHTPFEWFPILFQKAKEVDITAFSSVFDKTSVDLLENLGCPCYKIASFEITDIPLIRYAAGTGKPLIISTGMASWDEIHEVNDMLIDHDRAFLHCISGYPTPIEEANLTKITYMKENMLVGISDHTVGWAIPVAATALGVRIIEKHLMLPDDAYDPEHMPEDEDFSVNPAMFREMCFRVKQIWQAMQPSVAKSEEFSRQARRSLYVVEDIKEGNIFTEKNIRSIRPAYGLAPKYLDEILSQKATQDIDRGSALSWDMINVVHR